MKLLVQFVARISTSIPQWRPSDHDGRRCRVTQPVPRLGDRLRQVLTSRVTHGLLLLAAAVGNGLMLGALQYLNELAGPLSDLTTALASYELQAQK